MRDFSITKWPKSAGAYKKLNNSISARVENFYERKKDKHLYY